MRLLVALALIAPLGLACGRGARQGEGVPAVDATQHHAAPEVRGRQGPQLEADSSAPEVAGVRPEAGKLPVPEVRGRGDSAGGPRSKTSSP